MCGIAGIALLDQSTIDPMLLKALAQSLQHRGPDDLGFLGWKGNGVVRCGRDSSALAGSRVGLVHRRLAIIDRSEAGWQPMVSGNQRYGIIFNGEIYNYLELKAELKQLGYTFRSDSDTEVLLYGYSHWGANVLTRLVGMFAFAILDTQENKLFLARDCFGIKPLYYCYWNGGFVFASEITALIQLPGLDRRANPQRLYEYLRFGLTDHGDATLFAAISQLPAAHFLEVNLECPQEARPAVYWQAEIGQRSDLSFKQSAEQLRELFFDSVRLHLRSDVPVGAALSGGIDSSAIVMAMRHLGGKGLDIQTFSYIADEPSLSEERWVDLVGAAAGVTVHKIRPTATELVKELDDLIGVQGEPFATTSVFAQRMVFQRVAEAGIKVTLDGQGADELLGGYPVFAAVRLASLIRQHQWEDALRFLQTACRTRGLDRLWVTLRAGGMLVPEAWEGVARQLVREDLYPAWLHATWFAERGVVARAFGRVPDREMLKAYLRQTLAQSSLPALLRYSDRNAMSFSVESRVPFLTPSLANFIFTLPEEYLIAPDGTSKAIFRAAMRGIVPDAILDRTDKIGFVTPERRWLATMGDWVDETLSHEVMGQILPLRGEQIMREWRAIRRGGKAFDARTWRWINLIRWTERFSVTY